MELLPEWHEFLHALKRHGVRFLLVGAHALAAHGRPRYTADLDILIDPPPANARRVSAAIAEFGSQGEAGPAAVFSSEAQRLGAAAPKVICASSSLPASA